MGRHKVRRQRRNRVPVNRTNHTEAFQATPEEIQRQRREFTAGAVTAVGAGLELNLPGRKAPQENQVEAAINRGMVRVGTTAELPTAWGWTVTRLSEGRLEHATPGAGCCFASPAPQTLSGRTRPANSVPSPAFTDLRSECAARRRQHSGRTRTGTKNGPPHADGAWSPAASPPSTPRVEYCRGTRRPEARRRRHWERLPHTTLLADAEQGAPRLGECKPAARMGLRGSTARGWDNSFA